MTPHDEVKRDIPAYLAGRLDDASSARVSDHLAECDECADVVGFWFELLNGEILPLAVRSRPPRI